MTKSNRVYQLPRDPFRYLEVQKDKKGEKFLCKLCDAKWTTRVYALKHLDSAHAISGLNNNGNTARKPRKPGQGKGQKKKDAELLPMALHVTGGPETDDPKIIRKQVVIEIVLDVKTR